MEKLFFYNMIINGKEIASNILERLKKQRTSDKFLAAFLVGDDPASISFLKQKEKIAKELGVDFRLHSFPEKITQDELRKEILKIVEHNTCGGVIVQLPLPSNINRQYILNVIPREKDVDVLGERALGAFYAGRNPILPPAVGVVEEIVKDTRYKRQETRVAVVGLGFLVGKPISEWLKGKCAELYCLDIGSDLSVLKRADLVILGTGQAGLIKPEMVKNDALVIDFGYGTVGGKISGDFSAESLNGIQADPPQYEVLGGGSSRLESISYTPTPGGTGPIDVAKLFENFYELNG